MIIMADTFKLKVVASNKVFFDGDCLSLTIPMMDGGSKAFLAHHANTVTPVNVGEMKIKNSSGEEIFAFVGNGLLEFFSNECTLVCISAELPEEIDARRAKEAEIRAEENLRQKQSLLEYHQSQADLARAMERLKVKNRHEI